MEANNYAYKCDVTSSGMYGHCDYCHRYPPSTTEVSGKRYCWNCYNEEFSGTEAEFKDSDATFSCLGDNCEEEKLSYRQYIAGSCCSVALNYIINADQVTFFEITKLLEESKRAVDSAVEDSGAANDKLCEAKEELEKIEKSFKDAREKVELAEENAKAAENNLDEKRNWYKKVQKRALIVANNALQEDDSAGEIPQIKKTDEANEMNECRLCCNPYGDERPQAAVILCGYKACFNCLSTLPRKVCPHCRAEFTDDKLLKLH